MTMVIPPGAAVLLGADLDPDGLSRALSGAGAQLASSKVIESTCFASVRLRSPEEVAKALADRVDELVRVIIVHAPAGGRGQELDATVILAPPGREPEVEDWTDWVVEIAAEWLADIEGGFDEEDLAMDLAWAIAGELASTAAEPAIDPETPEDGWAERAIGALVGAGLIELTSPSSRGDLVQLVAHLLQDVDDETIDASADRLLDELVASDAVAEVFAEPRDIADVLRFHRPRR